MSYIFNSLPRLRIVEFQMTWNIQYLLLWAAIAAFTMYCLNWLWKRRWFYIHSWSVPGPLALPFIGMAYKFIFSREDPMNHIIKIINEYPSPVKMWMGSLLIYGLVEPSHIEKVLTNPNCLDKGFYYDYLTEIFGEGLLSAPTSVWKRHRKIIMPSFNQKVLESYIDTFVKQTSTFMQIMDKYVGRKDINIMDSLSPLFLDVICESIMGTEINAQSSNAISSIAKHLNRIMEIFVSKNLSVWGYSNCLWRLHPLYRESCEHAAAIHTVVQNIIRRKQEAKEDKRNIEAVYPEEQKSPKKMAFLDLLLEHSDFSDKELQDEVETFILAGFDTTTKTTCYLLEMLALFPEVQQKVYEEVIEVVGQHRDVEAADLPELKYTERVIKETTRLFPIVINYIRTLGEDIKIGKYTLPKGANAAICAIAIHRNPRYWSDPLKFDPDRFLTEEVAKRHPCCYIPFSYGPRNCIGGKYAIMEIKVAIAEIIKKYKLFTAYKKLEDIEVKPSILSLPKDGFKVYFEFR